MTGVYHKIIDRSSVLLVDRNAISGRLDCLIYLRICGDFPIWNNVLRMIKDAVWVGLR